MKKLAAMPYLLAFTFLMSTSLSLSQTDTIVVYDYSNHQITYLSVPLSGSTATHDQTSHNVGTLPGWTMLSQTPPSQNLFQGSQFSQISPADNFFNLLNFPVRANVKLIRYDGDTAKSQCSGTLVGDKWVLTAGHCLFFQNNWVMDSLEVAPSFNNGQYATGLPTSTALRSYIFKDSYNGSLSRDLGLIELKDPIGIQTGWLGMEYNEDTSTFSGLLCHKLSYPGGSSWPDTNLITNGDTMYYNYGLINILGLNHVGVASSSANGISGQSGSSFFHTNNSSEYNAIGVFNFSSAYNHRLIKQQDFHGFDYVMNNNPLGVELHNKTLSINIYPNPVTPQSILKWGGEQDIEFIKIWDQQGRLLFKTNQITGNSYALNQLNLQAGVYLVSLYDDRGPISSARLFVQ